MTRSYRIPYLLLCFGKILLLLASPSRSAVCILLVTFLLSACGTNLPAEAYPTYDPFAPVGGEGNVPMGEAVQAVRVAGGPTPTRAPISVSLPQPGSNLAST